MKKKNNIVVMVVLVAIICFAISAYADQEPKPPAQVEVVAPNPVPVEGSVEVTNPQLNVNVTNIPEVDVVNTQLDVNVANIPAREPEDMSIELSNFDSAQQDHLIYTVPDGKRFVIETASVAARLPIGVKPLRVGIIRHHSAAGRVLWIPMSLQGEGYGKTHWVGTEQFRIVVEPTQIVRFFALLSGVTGEEWLNANVFGYLIPVDSPSLAP